MSFLKKLFFGVAAALIACCAGILICALNPALTQKLSAALYDENGLLGGSRKEETPVIYAQSGQDSGIDFARLQEAHNGYVLPADDRLSIPQNVGGKNGYQQIQDTLSQIGEEEFAGQEETIPLAQTGEGLTFAVEKYPYYGMLTAEMQKIYAQIYANALALTERFAPVVPVNIGQLKNVFAAVYNDHPELFWLETGYSCRYLPSGACVDVTLQYNQTAANLGRSQKAFEDQADRLLKACAQARGEEEKLRKAHDELVKQTEYDDQAPMNQSAYSALVEGKSVCAGYARAYQYLLQRLGIPCYYCTGYSGEDHAWNIVKLGKGFTNVDVTWDDTKPATYQFFCKTDAQIADTHIRRDLSVYLPACGQKVSEKPLTIESAPAKEEPEKQPAQTQPEQPQETETGSGSDAEDIEVLDTLEKYYADCFDHVKIGRPGSIQFCNVIPATLWNVIEQEYASENYKAGYVDQALQELGLENFTIQLQGVGTQDGYCRVYHNIYVW